MLTQRAALFAGKVRLPLWREVGRAWKPNLSGRSQRRASGASLPKCLGLHM